MRTKNFFLTAAFIICGLVCVNGVNGQTPTGNDQVTVNIKLNPIQAIVVNASQEQVDLVYTTVEDYKDGKTSGVLSKHLTVYSAGKFVVNVKAGTKFIDTEGNTIEAGDVTVKLTPSEGTAIGSEKSVTLSTDDQALITTTTGGGNGLEYDVEYDNTAGGNYQYTPKYTITSGEQVYTATITYSIIAG